jgi:hypothetical protein
MLALTGTPTAAEIPQTIWTSTPDEFLLKLKIKLVRKNGEKLWGKYKQE